MAHDRLLTCVSCGVSFVWTIPEQEAASTPDCCPACRRLAPAADRQRGLVKWFSRGRGYGFITPVQGPEIFVHKSGLRAGQPPLCVGQLVEYRVVQAGRGSQAADVILLHSPD
jgi:CspA family cold shock protein